LAKKEGGTMCKAMCFLRRKWRRISLRVVTLVIDLYLFCKRREVAEAKASNVISLTRFDSVCLSRITAIYLLPPNRGKRGFKIRLESESELSRGWLLKLRLWVRPKTNPNSRVLYRVDDISDIEGDFVLEVTPANWYWRCSSFRARLFKIENIKALCFAAAEREERYFCLKGDMEWAQKNLFDSFTS
jgi:hypothetical protein